MWTGYRIHLFCTNYYYYYYYYYYYLHLLRPNDDYVFI